MLNSCFVGARNTLLSIAKHYETGELLPEEIYAKLVAAKNFRAGTFSLRQVCLYFIFVCIVYRSWSHTHITLISNKCMK